MVPLLEISVASSDHELSGRWLPRPEGIVQRIVSDVICAQHLGLEIGLVGLVDEFSPAELSLGFETLADDRCHEGRPPLVHGSERRDGVVLVVQDVLDDVVLASEAGPVQVP